MDKRNETYLHTFRSLLMAHGLSVFVFCVLATGIGMFYSGKAFLTALGVLLGGAGGALQILSMSYSIPKAVMHHPADAQKYMLKHYLLRLLIMIALLFFGVLKGKWMLIGITVGLLCVKLGGFLAPLLQRKLYNKQ